MECRVYDLELRLLGSVVTWVSLVWEERYNTVGTFQLELQQREELLELFQPDRWCWLVGQNTLMLIQSVQVADCTVLVNGRSAVCLFAQRVSTQVISHQNAEDAMRSLFASMQPWPCVELDGSAGLADRYEGELSDKTLLEYFEAISQATDIGFRLRFDRWQKKLLFGAYKPRLNRNAVYSRDYGNVGGLRYTASTLDYKNVAMVAGAGEGSQRITVLAGQTDLTGAARREMYVDARGVQPADGESETAYKNRLVRHGLQKLAEQTRTEQFDFTPGDAATLGDVVRCRFPSLGLVQVRIVGINITSQVNGVGTQYTLGSPLVIRRT